jgi:hypothetical protein
MKFVMVIRQTEEWDKMWLEKYWDSKSDRFFCCFAPENSEKYKRLFTCNMERWERLRLNFFQYRHFIKNMVMKRWIADWINLKDALEMPEDKDVVFLPIDDDDLLKPGLLELLEEIFQDPEIEAVTWKTWCHSTMRGREKYFVEPNHQCVRTPSNCYAIRSNVANRRMMLVNHLVFSDSEVKKTMVDQEWGLRFFHPASMFRAQRENTLYQMHNIKRCDRPAELEWAHEVIEEMFDLTSSLMKVKML